MEEIGRNQIPSGGCARCGKFENEDQDFLGKVLAPDEMGHWLCAECLAEKVRKYFDELSKINCFGQAGKP